MGLRQSAGRDNLNTATAFAAYEAVRQRLPALTRAGACEPVCSLADIADRFDVFLLDAFGILNIGETAIEGTADRVGALQAAGKRVLVVTNAASFPRPTLLAKYARLGYSFEPEDVISSRAATLCALQSEPARRWGLMADPSHDHDDLKHLDTRFLGNHSAAYNAADGFLLLGSGNWSEHRQKLLESSLVAHPRPVLVGNPDIVAPREVGFSTEPGSYAHRLADNTGIQPRFFGKPFGNIFDLAFQHLGDGYDKSRILMVGDSLHTDILGGLAAGVKTALNAGHGFFAGSDVDCAIASSGIQPDFILQRP